MFILTFQQVHFFLPTDVSKMLLDKWQNSVDSDQKPYSAASDLGLHCLAVSIQLSLNSSNTDGSFTMANPNLFFSPYEVLPIAQENKYLGKFSYFVIKLYVQCTH